MRVQVTVVVTDGEKPGGIARVDSTTLVFRHGINRPGLRVQVDDADIIIANAARQVARRLGLGLPTPEKEGGRG